MAKTACGFCRGTKHKISKEHVFGRWLGPLFGIGTGDVAGVMHTFRRDDGEPRHWTALAIDQQVDALQALQFGLDGSA